MQAFWLGDPVALLGEWTKHPPGWPPTAEGRCEDGGDPAVPDEHARAGLHPAPVPEARQARAPVRLSHPPSFTRRPAGCGVSVGARRGGRWRRYLGALLLSACAVASALPAGAAPPPAAVTPMRALPEQAGDAIPDAATQRALLDRSYAYFAAKDGGRLDAAYADFAPSVRAYLTPDLFRAQATAFNAAAGAGGERRVVLMTWEKDPPAAAAPGLYVAADFVARFPNIRLHCGYLMWHREADGAFRIVREEQSFLDEATARQMTPERLRPLPAQFGCPGASAGE